MTNLQKQLLLACNKLGIEIELDYVLSLTEDKKINTVAYIPSFGGPKGMLIVSSSKGISQVWDNLDYGFSVLDEPHDKEEFDLDSFKEMFIDWGWSVENPKNCSKTNGEV